MPDLGESIQTDPIWQRLMELADFIETTPLRLARPSIWLRYDDPRPEYSMLGLMCEAYSQLSGNGYWRRSVSPKVPEFVCEGEATDRALPRGVVNYFGLRDMIGSFAVSQLPQQIKNSMRSTRKSANSSLYDVGLTYPQKGKWIASEVLRSMPSSLLKLN